MRQTLRNFSPFIAVLLFAVLAPAQNRITVKVPFDFFVADKTLKAGLYSVSASRDTLAVENSEGRTVFIAMANAVSARRVGPNGQLVFHCYGRRCFLSELWTPKRVAGSQLLVSRYEKEMARQGPATEFAFLPEPRDGEERRK